VEKNALEGQAVIIRHSAPNLAFEGNQEKSCINVVGYLMAEKCAQDVYQQSGLTPEDV
jgi:hypothetical protein